MPQNLPESEELDLRDYLFVDRQRVGSLLAQLVHGLPTDRTETNTRSRKLLGGIQQMLAGERIDEYSHSQSLALADLHVSQLEENAFALGMLSDISDQVTKRKDWLRGRVRKLVKPGMLLRVTAPTQLADVQTIVDSIQSLENAFEGPQADNNFSAMVRQISALYGQSVTVSVRAAGADEFQVGFVGEIPYDFEFGPARRELLLSQIGAQPTELTTLMQVAVVPSERDPLVTPGSMLAELKLQAMRLPQGQQNIDRRFLDQMMSALGGLLSQSGFVSAPKWPAISMIPLAIYRAVPSSVELSDDELSI